MEEPFRERTGVKVLATQVTLIQIPGVVGDSLQHHQGSLLSTALEHLQKQPTKWGGNASVTTKLL